jgi:hypothetical protein
VIAVGDIVGGRFRIDASIGAGGMGVVMAATHLELGHRVAIKFLRDEMAGNPSVVDRFLREARAVANLRTEHVCRVTDVGHTAGGAPFIVMELLEGVDLQHVVARQPLPPPLAVSYVIQACVALAEAHAAGIIHRDLKPANLFVTRRLDGTPLVKVLDFGIAKAIADTGAQLTHTQGALGSPGYMSPEQLQSPRDVDVRSDIWALGVTLYQLLTARLPFAGTTLANVAVKVATEPPAPLTGVDPQLAAIVMRCLDKARKRRFGDVASLAVELARFAEPSAQALVPIVQTLVYRQASYAPAPASVATRPTQATATPLSVPATSRSHMPIAVAALVAVGGIAIAVAVIASHSPPHAVVSDAAKLAVVPDAAAVIVQAPPDAADEVESPPLADVDVNALLGSDTSAMYKRNAAMLCQQHVKIGDAHAQLMVDAMCACVQGDAKRAQQLAARLPANERTSVDEFCKLEAGH